MSGHGWQRLGGEGTVCAAALTALGIWRRETIEVIGAPDQEERRRPAVDVLGWLTTSGSELAVEHTILEAFPDQIRDAKEFSDLMGPLQDRLKGKLPTPGVFVLGLKPYAVRGARKGDLDALAGWIEAKAANLEYRPPPWSQVAGKPPEVPFHVWLGRWGMGPHGELRAAEFTAQGDRAALLRASVGKALTANSQKLGDEHLKGRLTVLVFERVEVGLMNVPDVAEAVRAECARLGLGPVPHWILLAEPVFGSPCPLTVIKEATAFWPDLMTPSAYSIPAA